MRIEGPNPHPWQVYHAERCELLPFVVWVDDVTCQWCEYVQPLRAEGGEIVKRTHQAKRIAIYPELALVVINPLQEEEPAAASSHEEIVA